MDRLLDLDPPEDDREEPWLLEDLELLLRALEDLDDDVLFLMVLDLLLLEVLDSFLPDCLLIVLWLDEEELLVLLLGSLLMVFERVSRVLLGVLADLVLLVDRVFLVDLTLLGDRVFLVALTPVADFAFLALILEVFLP